MRRVRGIAVRCAGWSGCGCCHVCAAACGSTAEHKAAPACTRHRRDCGRRAVIQACRCSAVRVAQAAQAPSGHAALLPRSGAGSALSPAAPECGACAMLPRPPCGAVAGSSAAGRADRCEPAATWTCGVAPHRLRRDTSAPLSARLESALSVCIVLLQIAVYLRCRTAVPAKGDGGALCRRRAAGPALVHCAGPSRLAAGRACSSRTRSVRRGWAGRSLAVAIRAVVQPSAGSALPITAPNTQQRAHFWHWPCRSSARRPTTTSTRTTTPRARTQHARCARPERTRRGRRRGAGARLALPLCTHRAVAGTPLPRLGGAVLGQRAAGAPHAGTPRPLGGAELRRLWRRGVRGDAAAVDRRVPRLLPPLLRLSRTHVVCSVQGASCT